MQVNIKHIQRNVKKKFVIIYRPKYINKKNKSLPISQRHSESFDLWLARKIILQIWNVNARLRNHTALSSLQFNEKK